MRLHGAKQKSFGLGCHELTCIYKGRGIQTAVLNHHGLDRSQWPAHSYLRANSFPAEQRWLSWVWNKCFILPLQGPARQRLRQCHSFRTVFLQHCKQDQIDLCCLFALYNPRVIRVGNNIRRSLNPTSVQSTGHTELRNFLFGAFLQSGLKNYQGFWTTSSNTLLSSKWFFFSLYIKSETLISACASYLSTSSCESLCRAWLHLLTDTGDAVKFPKVFPSPGWSSPAPWASDHRASMSGIDHCAGSHSRFLSFSPPGSAGLCQGMCFPARQTPAQTSTP